MDIKAQVEQASMSGSNAAGSSIEPALNTLAPGALMPDHHHPHEQLGYVVEGSLLLKIAREERNLQPAMPMPSPAV
jgi:quercetin dioxygenase-like cupin family protein